MRRVVSGNKYPGARRCYVSLTPLQQLGHHNDMTPAASEAHLWFAVQSVLLSKSGDVQDMHSANADRASALLRWSAISVVCVCVV